VQPANKTKDSNKNMRYFINFSYWLKIALITAAKTIALATATPAFSTGAALSPATAHPA
jgi:hypothetical protein